MYCIYCDEQHDDPDRLMYNREHVLPCALGVPDKLSVRVCKESNSRFAKELDQPLMRDPVIRFLRFAWQVRGDYSHTEDHVDIGEACRRQDGASVPYRVSNLGGTLDIGLAHPVVSTEGDRLTIRARETEIDSIFAKVNRRRARHGATPFLREEMTVRPIEIPTVLNDRSPMNGRGLAVAYIRVALLLAAYESGEAEAFGRSPAAAALRRAVQLCDPTGVHVQIKPAGVAEQIGVAGRHVLLLGEDGHGPVVQIALFGGALCGRVRLERWRGPHEGAVHVIDPIRRKSERIVACEFGAREVRSREQRIWTM